VTDTDPAPSQVVKVDTPPDNQTVLDHRQQNFNLPLPPALQSLVDLEKQRIDSFNRRTDVVKYAIETNDAADRRQYEYMMAKLTADTDSRTQRHKLMKVITIGGGIAATIFLGGLFGFTFFGSATQSDMGLSILKVLGTGLGGYGSIAAILNGVRRLTAEKESR
jgi:hypothetical protein